MEENKSIDGLSTHTAKKIKVVKTNSTITPKVAPKAAPKKVAPSPVAPKKVASKPEIVPEDSIEINVVEDSTAKIEESKTPSRDKVMEDFLNPIEAFNLGDEDDVNNKPDNNTEEAVEPEEEEVPEEKEVSKKDIKQQKKALKKAKKQAKKAKKSYKVRKVITIILLVIVVGAIGFITWAVFWGNDIIAKITGGQGNVFDLFTLVDEHYEPLKTDSNGRTNILAFGTSGYNMSGDEGDGWAHAGAQLTDSIMMISVNQDTGDIAMLSLPRDLKASPTCTATGKINEVYWCNGGGYEISLEDEAGAAQALMEEVGSILGVSFQYYAHLNWGSLVSIVDMLGGITITLDEDIEDYYWTGAVFEAGIPYTINGEQALGLARARHGTMGGDFSRGASQQKILIGIKDKIFEKGLSLTDIISLASTLGDNFRSNFSLSELKTAAHLTFEFDLSSMRQISLFNPLEGIYYMRTGTLDNGISYVFPSAGVGNYGDIQEYVAFNLSNDPRTYEVPTIAILNASETTGLAAKEKTKLEEQGFTISYTDNAPEGEYETGTTLYINTNNKPGTKNLLNTIYGNIKWAADIPEGVTHDYDFIIIINPEEGSEEQ